MSSVLKIGFLVLGIVLVTVWWVGSWLGNIENIIEKAQIKINNQYIIADIVSSEEDRARGLSGRKSLEINEGMFFLFEVPGSYGFWMKDMHIPIDIVWIKNFEVVGIEENVLPEPGVKPSELKIYFPPTPVDRVLELKAGRAKLLKLNVGDRILVRPLIPS